MHRFVILSNQTFDFDLKTNKWHVANQLNLKGHSVLFVDPPLRLKNFRRKIKKAKLNLFKIFRFHYEESGIHVYSPTNLFNFPPFSLLNTYIHSSFINARLKKMSGDKIILWVYHFDFPDLENFIRNIDYDLIIYDVVDEYEAFPEYSSNKSINTGLFSMIESIDKTLKSKTLQNGLMGVDWVRYREKWLANIVDLLFVSAPGLIKKFQKYRDRVHYFPNACEPEAFDLKMNKLQEPNDLLNISHPRIGFSGAIDQYKNNLILIEKAANTYPKYQFILIGPERVSDPDLDLKKLKSLPNVHFLGKKPYKETPVYFNYFDVYFIPYKLNKYTVNGCFPVKYFEALAAGLPTVVTDLPAYHEFNVDGLVSKSDSEFIKNLKLALETNSDAKVLKRKELAYKNSWSNKVDKQLELIDKKLKKG